MIDFLPSLDFVFYSCKEVLPEVELKENQVIVKGKIFIEKTNQN